MEVDNDEDGKTIFYSEFEFKNYSFNDYVLLDKLGQGSYGKVFLIKNKKNSKLYAAKKVKLDCYMNKSTNREIHILQLLQHPNITKVYQILVNSKKIHIVMDYMYMSLDVFIHNYDIDLSRFKFYQYQLLAGLNHIHERAIVHRDVKSANILVSHCTNIVKFCDFGLARKLDREVMSPRVVTFRYRCPELLTPNAGYYDNKIDVWSLGCVFLEMLTKKIPFNGVCVMDMWYSFFTQLGVPLYQDNSVAIALYFRTDFRTQEELPDNIRILREKVDENGYNLVMDMLEYNPCKRISCRDAARSRYFDDLDKSNIPAIVEANILDFGQSKKKRLPRKLYKTAEYIQYLCRHSEQLNLDDPDKKIYKGPVNENWNYMHI